MAPTVVIGCADQALAYELRSQLAEAVADVDVAGVAETTAELTALVVGHEVDLVLVHDDLGPEPVHQVVRDLSLRRPASITLVVSADDDPGAMSTAMDAGARGVLRYPLSFAEVQQRVVNALDWSRHMRELLANAGTSDPSVRGRATVVAVGGSKGGVGTTTLATHLAWDVKREVPSHKVLVVDLDLEKGDVSSLVEARYRTSIADLAKVADDLSVRTVADAVFEHESGLHLLLPPLDVRDVEWVTPAAIRQVLALVRQQYDLVVIDVGSHVTAVQAAVVEIADEVVAVVTPDLISLRALRRNLGWWESLGVRKQDAVHVLLNKHSKADEIQPETARKLSPATLLATVVPDVGRRLETASNSRTPELVTDVSWWRTLRAFGREVGVVRARAADDDSSPRQEGRPVVAVPQVPGAAPGQGPESAEAGDVEQGGRRAGGRRALRGGTKDRGAVSVEFLGVIPAVLLVVAMLWQLGVVGMTYMWTGYAASAAARAAAVHETPLEVREAARDRVPAGLRSSLQVTTGPGSRVSVQSKVPLVAPGVLDLPWTVQIDRQVVREP